MIPRRLHRIWLGDAPIPEEYEAYWAEWQSMHPEWECTTHGESEVINRKLYAALSSMSAKSDLLRYEIMQREGGVYVDTDFQPLRPLDPLLETGVTCFAGWEDEQRVCTALFGCVPGHPALSALVSGLPAWASRHARQTPDTQTGPVFFTSVLNGRPDVTLFPPPVFYPVSYWDRTRIEELRPTLPAEAFALHHWGRSWMPEAKRRADDAAAAAMRPRNVAILVPRKADGGQRDAVWAWLKTRWQANLPQAQIVEGESDPFNRARSINSAAQAAQGADVFVIVDADSWCDPAAVKAAIAGGLDYQLPWTPGYKLTEAATADLLRRDPLGTRLTRSWVASRLDEPPHTHLSGVVVVTREAFEAVGGFDERFTGWGFEDTAFIYALDNAAGRPSGSGCANPRGTAALIHLWHAPAPDAGAPAPESLALFNEYRALRGLGPWSGQ